MGGAGALTAAQEYRMASAYARSYPQEIAAGRAAIFGEENPYFTVQRARVLQVCQSFF